MRPVRRLISPPPPLPPRLQQRHPPLCRGAADLAAQLTAGACTLKGTSPPRLTALGPGSQGQGWLCVQHSPENRQHPGGRGGSLVLGQPPHPLLSARARFCDLCPNTALSSGRPGPRRLLHAGGPRLGLSPEPVSTACRLTPTPTPGCPRNALTPVPFGGWGCGLEP